MLVLELLAARAEALGSVPRLLIAYGRSLISVEIDARCARLLGPEVGPPCRIHAKAGPQRGLGVGTVLRLGRHDVLEDADLERPACPGVRRETFGESPDQIGDDVPWLVLLLIFRSAVHSCLWTERPVRACRRLEKNTRRSSRNPGAPNSFPSGPQSGRAGVLPLYNKKAPAPLFFTARRSVFIRQRARANA